MPFWGGRITVSDAIVAVTADPTEERRWGHLMVALYRTGRTAEAVRAFDRARMALDRELGTPYQELLAAGSPQWAACAQMIAVWAQTLSGAGGDPATAFEAFDAYTHDGSTVMTPFFLGLLADIETHCGRIDHAHQLLARAKAVVDATGEHAWDQELARRITALSRSGFVDAAHAASSE
jgi:Bacterial transcriptional activator domain